jgi:L-alanine-DL-glutamate epimerase-like enolase superfamily enzyme
VAVWHLLGKSTGLPAYILFGGRCSDSIPILQHLQRTMATTSQATGGIREKTDESWHHRDEDLAL